MSDGHFVIDRTVSSMRKQPWRENLQPGDWTGELLPHRGPASAGNVKSVVVKVSPVDAVTLPRPATGEGLPEDGITGDGIGVSGASRPRPGTIAPIVVSDLSWRSKNGQNTSQKTPK